MANRDITAKKQISAILLLVFGSLLTAFCGLMTIAGLFTLGDSSSASFAAEIFLIVFFGILTVLGILLILRGVHRNNDIRCYKRILPCLQQNGTQTVQWLAGFLKMPPERTQKSLARMVGEGYFPGVYLDTQRGLLVVPNTPSSAGHTPAAAPVKPSQANPVPVQPVYVAVTCKGCGAVSKITKGSVGECEFCGSKLSE